MSRVTLDREHLEAFLAAVPKCEAIIDSDGATCNAPATHDESGFFEQDGELACAAHKRKGAPELPHAPAIRAALAALGAR